MYRYIYFLTLSLVLIQSCSLAKPNRSFFQFCETLFDKHATEEIDYAYIREHTEGINEHLATIDSAQVAESDSTEKLAFWINLHNLLVLREISSFSPRHSLTEHKGFWKDKIVTIAGERLSLQDIQQKKLLNKYPDPRIIFALYLGVHTSPLQEIIFIHPQHPAEDLDKATREAFNNQKFIRVKPESKYVVLPELLKWHFPHQTPEGFIHWINDYRSRKEKIPLHYKVAFYPFSWEVR